ncbi:MAG: hypothetical protein M5R40_11570 [Anaerolineae bacterium]|nr:hypothetical protein [Anaerolineae bacterium]
MSTRWPRRPSGTRWSITSTGPKLFVEAGRFRGDVDNHFFGFPQLVEMLYLWLMSWRGPAAGAALIHWAFGVLMLMLAGGFAARLTGKARVGLMAAAVLLTAETIWWEFAWPYVDLAAMAYVMAGFVLLDVWREESALPALAVAGLMAGCALGAKYTTVGAVAGLGVLALWDRVAQSAARGPRQRFDLLGRWPWRASRPG